jgi:hypothetical protein
MFQIDFVQAKGGQGTSVTACAVALHAAWEGWQVRLDGHDRDTLAAILAAGGGGPVTPGLVSAPTRESGTTWSCTTDRPPTAPDCSSSGPDTWQLDDIAYGRRRVMVRVRDDHPHGVRARSRAEPVVDLFEPEALAAVSDYVLRERPTEATSPFVFLVGARPPPLPAIDLPGAGSSGRPGGDPSWYPGAVGHAPRVRHTHATRMWEGGMRELTLQCRLGHASVESTRVCTRVSDHQVVARSSSWRRHVG